MSKLVDKERLAKLAKALDERAKAAAAQAEANAKAHAEEKDEVLAGRIQTLEGLVVGGEGEGLEAVIGDVAQNKADIAALKEFQEGHSHDEFAKQADLEEVEGIAQAAKGAIDVFMAAADVQEGAIDTLKEIQAYIESDGAAAEEMLANIAAAQKAADDEKVRAEAEEAAIRQEMAEAVAGVHGHDNKEVLDGIDAEKVAAWDKAQENAEAKAAELDAALKLELQAEIDDDVKVVADDLALEKAKIVALQEFVEGHKDFDASELEGKIQALEEFQASHQDYNDAEVRGLIKDNADDILELQQAVEEKVEEEQVKTMLGNVVSSLSLQMVDNKVQLSLGGVDGIAIAEVELDVATDDDIDEIIAGLDEE
jgi:hypothetical protein